MFNLPIQGFDLVIVPVTPALGAIWHAITRHVLGPKRLLSGLLTGSLVTAATSLASPTLARIITFDPAKSVDTQPLSINANGSVVGWYLVTENGDSHGFLYSPDGTMTLFDVPKAKCGTIPRSINRMGVIAGGFNDRNCNEHGFIRTADGTFTEFDVPGATETAPIGINDKGAIAGFYNVCSNGCLQLHGFMRAADGTIMTFDPAGSIGTIPESINKSGVIGGSYEDNAQHEHGFVRAADGKIQSFDPPNSVSTFALSINDSGAIAGYFIQNDTGYGFLRSAKGTFTIIDPEEAAVAVVFAVNDDDSVTGYYQMTDGYAQGFVQTSAGKVTTFNPKGSVDTNPVAINSKGVITGYWQNENPGPIHGFLRTR